MISHGDAVRLEVGCIPHEEQAGYEALHLTLVISRTVSRQANINLFFFDENGEQIDRLIGWRVHPITLDTIRRVGDIVAYRAEGTSQGIIDSMLKTGATRLDVSVSPSGSDSVPRTIDISNFPAVHEILLDHCQRTSTEAKASVAASVLKAPTLTPASPPTPTSTPMSAWQQEWCKEQGIPSFGVEGYWDPSSGVDGTARLVIQCTSGVLIVGVHITRGDGAYPSNESDIAFGVEDGKEFRAYQHYVEGLQLVGGDDDEGLFLILPDSAVRDVIDTVYDPQYKDALRVKLWILFDAGQDPRLDDHSLGTDVIIPVGKDAVTHPIEGM